MLFRVAFHGIPPNSILKKTKQACFQEVYSSKDKTDTDYHIPRYFVLVYKIIDSAVYDPWLKQHQVLIIDSLKGSLELLAFLLISLSTDARDVAVSQEKSVIYIFIQHTEENLICFFILCRCSVRLMLATTSLEPDSVIVIYRLLMRMSSIL